MEETRAGITDVINKYKPDVDALIKYLSWLEQKSGGSLMSNYSPEGTELSMKVPVYDSTLLSFVKLANKTKFMNKNYMYTYSRYKIKDARDELRVIEQTQIMDMQVLGDILSCYIMKGMRKGTVWNDGIKDGVFYCVVKRMKELIEFWTVPM